MPEHESRGRGRGRFSAAVCPLWLRLAAMGVVPFRHLPPNWVCRRRRFHTCTGVESSFPMAARALEGAWRPPSHAWAARRRFSGEIAGETRIPHLYRCGILLPHGGAGARGSLATTVACLGSKAALLGRDRGGDEDSTPVQVWNPPSPWRRGRSRELGDHRRMLGQRGGAPRARSRGRRGFHTCTGVESSFPMAERALEGALPRPSHAWAARRRSSGEIAGETRIPHVYRCGILLPHGGAGARGSLATTVACLGSKAALLGRDRGGDEDSTPVQVWSPFSP